MTEGSWRVWLSMALVASIAANVYLFRIAQQRGEGETRGNRYTLREGDRVPPVEGNSREGGSVRVEYGTDARPTVLYVVTATCAWCSRNAENFASIVRQKQQSHRFVVVALHREKLDQLASTMPEGVDFLAEVSEQTKQQVLPGRHTADDCCEFPRSDREELVGSVQRSHRQGGGGLLRRQAPWAHGQRTGD